MSAVRWTRVVLALAVACALQGTGSIAARAATPIAPSKHTTAPTAPPSTTRVMKRFAPINMAGSHFTPTLAQAVAMAQQFDVVTALYFTFPPSYVAAMKAANPNLVVFVYVNGALAQATQGPASKKGYPLADYLLDAFGNPVRSITFGNYLMDVSNPDWIGRVGGQCASFLGVSHYDGCLIDVLGDSIFGRTYLTAVPVHASTGRPWTPVEWLGATGALAAAVRAANPTVPVAGNGLINGSKYFDPTAPTSTLLNGIALGQAEFWLRQASDPVNSYRPESDWKRDVDMIVNAESRGDGVLATTKLWLNPATVTDGQRQAWHKYALASFRGCHAFC